MVVTAREAPGDCAALLIDRKAWRANGAMALRWTGDRFELERRPADAVTSGPGRAQPRRASERTSPGAHSRARCDAAEQKICEAGD